MKTHFALAALAAVTFSATATAQTLKPGLWEVTQNMQGGGGPGESASAQARMQKEMAAMSPEQRKMVEQMMAKQGAKPGGAGGMSVRTCMTKEMAERNEVPAQKGDCKTTKQSKSGNTMKFSYTCANPPSTGEGEYTYMGSEAYKSKLVVSTTRGGKPETMTLEGSGKWLGADCGSIKPPAMPQKK